MLATTPDECVFDFGEVVEVVQFGSSRTYRSYKSDRTYVSLVNETQTIERKCRINFFDEPRCAGD